MVQRSKLLNLSTAGLVQARALQELLGTTLAGLRAGADCSSRAPGASTGLPRLAEVLDTMATRINEERSFQLCNSTNKQAHSAAHAGEHVHALRR